MFCQSCGHKAHNDASFCGNCGKAGAYLIIIILYILIRGHAYAYPPGRFDVMRGNLNSHACTIILMAKIFCINTT
jgi:hypothetical protein